MDVQQPSDRSAVGGSAPGCITRTVSTGGVREGELTNVTMSVKS